MDARRRVDELKATIRAAGLRATPSRLAVLGVVRGHPAPLSHADVADRLADQVWDRATIYRNLIDLADAGVLRRTDVGDHVWRFELAGDHALDQHPHFVCTECGVVECLPEAEIGFRKRTPRAVRRREVEIQLRGLCDACE
jgi:Fur family ferric uptake transcriptional regulator